MKKIGLILLILVKMTTVYSQEDFVFNKGVDEISIPIKVINNLIFIPIAVNGIELNFLLDTGVEDIILFSLEDNPDVKFFNSQKINLRGLGSMESIEGLKTTNNILEVEGLKAMNQLVYVILDESINLSSQIGIPVNGIIGYHFFKDHLVSINYIKKKLTVSKNNQENSSRLRKRFKEIPISIEKNKPYLLANVLLDQKNVPVKLLIDNGNSDSVWLFQNLSDDIMVPARNFEDFLGKGFSGDIQGKRARISKFTFDKFTFESPIIAFPDSSSIKSVRMVENRLGSVGGGILKRFSVVFDYKNEKMYLKANSDFSEPFTYNKSGIEIQHHGLQWVQETVQMETVPVIGSVKFDSSGKNITNEFKYKIVLKPIYEISNLRKNSPAAISGLQVGDIVISVNKKKVYLYSLQKLNEMFRVEDTERLIVLEIERNGQLLIFSFQLLDVL
jgi:hypothetical protein